MFNPVFIFLVILAAFILWFLLSFIFPIIGRFMLTIWNKTKENIKKN